MFVPTSTMPGWLQALGEGQPGHAPDRRDPRPAGRRPGRRSGRLVAWLAGAIILAIFAPLAVAAYRRKTNYPGVGAAAQQAHRLLARQRRTVGRAVRAVVAERGRELFAQLGRPGAAAVLGAAQRRGRTEQPGASSDRPARSSTYASAERGRAHHRHVPIGHRQRHRRPHPGRPRVRDRRRRRPAWPGRPARDDAAAAGRRATDSIVLAAASASRARLGQVAGLPGQVGQPMVDAGQTDRRARRVRPRPWRRPARLGRGAGRHRARMPRRAGSGVGRVLVGGDLGHQPVGLRVGLDRALDVAVGELQRCRWRPARWPAPTGRRPRGSPPAPVSGSRGAPRSGPRSRAASRRAASGSPASTGRSAPESAPAARTPPARCRRASPPAAPAGPASGARPSVPGLSARARSSRSTSPSKLAATAAALTAPTTRQRPGRPAEPRRAARRAAGSRVAAATCSLRAVQNQASAAPSRGRRVGVAGVDGEPHRGDQVVPLGGELRIPLQLLGAAQVRVGLLGDGQEVQRVRPLDRGHLARRGQPLGPVLPEGLEHPVARLAPPAAAAAATCRSARRAGRARRRAAPGRRRRPRSAASGLTPPGKTATRSASAASALGEQVPAPGDHRAQRLVPGQRGPAAAGQQPEPVVEPGGDLGRPAASASGPRPARWPAACRPARGRSPPPARRVVGVDLKPGRTAAARSASSRTAGKASACAGAASDGGRPSGATGGQRLAGDRRAAPGWWPGCAAAGSGPAARPRCGRRRRSGARSCPARSARAGRRAGRRAAVSASAWPGWLPAQRVAPARSRRARPAGPAAASVTGASSASQVPPGNRSSTRTAASAASRVLPAPPGPTSVTSRCRPSSSVTGRGRRPGRRSW